MGLAKWLVTCITFMNKQTIALLMNFGVEIPPLRQAKTGDGNYSEGAG